MALSDWKRIRMFQKPAVAVLTPSFWDDARPRLAAATRNVIDHARTIGLHCVRWSAMHAYAPAHCLLMHGAGPIEDWRHSHAIVLCPVCQKVLWHELET